MSTEELTRQAQIVKRNRSVPYEDMDRAVEIGRGAFPDADEVTRGMYDGSPIITVWTEGRGHVYTVDLDAGLVVA